MLVWGEFCGMAGEKGVFEGATALLWWNDMKPRHSCRGCGWKVIGKSFVLFQSPRIRLYHRSVVPPWIQSPSRYNEHLPDLVSTL